MGSTEKIEAQIRLVELTDQILSQKIDIATGVWAINGLLYTLGIEMDEDYLIFNAFTSETDHLPLPKDKQTWTPERYTEKATELQRIEAEYKDRIVHACSLLKEFLKHQQY